MERGGWVEAPLNHLSAKNVNNAGKPGIRHSDLKSKPDHLMDGGYFAAGRKVNFLLYWVLCVLV